MHLCEKQSENVKNGGKLAGMLEETQAIEQSRLQKRKTAKGGRPEATL